MVMKWWCDVMWCDVMWCDVMCGNYPITHSIIHTLTLRCQHFHTHTTHNIPHITYHTITYIPHHNIPHHNIPHHNMPHITYHTITYIPHHNIFTHHIHTTTYTHAYSEYVHTAFPSEFWNIQRQRRHRIPNTTAILMRKCGHIMIISNYF